MDKKEYYGSMCITARVNFWLESEKTIEEVKEQLLSMGFGITFYDEEGNEIKDDVVEITEMEGCYTDSFEIYEEEC